MAAPQTEAATACPAGTCVGPYTIVRQIGEGGMARLYLATDSDGGEHVLKLPRDPTEIDPASQIAFENELRLAPYLGDFARVLQSREDDGTGDRYLVLKYIDGTDLWSHLRTNGCPDEREAATLARKIVRALAELHDRRIVHLDVKLSNIMLTPTGEVRLIDFGLANHLDLHDLIRESFHEPKGTPAYIAPEQFFGVRDEPRSDIYSIGTLLFEMTTSRLPFPEAHSELDVISRIKREPVSPRVYRPELSNAFETIVMTCLETHPDRRYADMRTLDAELARLETILERQTPRSPPATAPGRMAALASRLMRRPTGEGGDRLATLKRWVASHRSRQLTRTCRIVVALDSQEDTRTSALNRNLLESALHLARLQPAIVTVLTVLPPQDTGMASAEREAQILNSSFHRARSYMNRLLPPADENAIPVGINVRTGNVVEAIRTCVDDYGADLLVIGARNRNAISRFLLGSTTYKVLTTLSCPVFVVREDRNGIRPARCEAKQIDESAVEVPEVTSG